MLKGAHVYIYAALLADFVREAKRDDFIGPAVQMNDSTIKPTEEFILDHLFEVTFKPLLERGGQEFLAAVRTKANLIVETHRRLDSECAA
jgi:hypothetical protein